MADEWAGFDEVKPTKPSDDWAGFDEVGGSNAEAKRTVAPYANAQAPGMVEQGNIELWNRPAYLHDDYKTSKNYGTTESFSKQDDDGKEVLVPQIVDGKRFKTQDEAWAHYKKTGEHLGKFDDPDKADQYATALHNAQAMYVDSKGGPEKFVKPIPSEGELLKKDPWLQGLPANTIAGGIKAITGIPAALGAASDAVLGAPQRPIPYARTPTAGDVGQGITDYINQSLPINPDKDVQATNAGERIAQFTGGSVVGALTPVGEATIAQKALSGARFGLGGGIAQEAVPDWAKPYAAIIGGIGADIGGSLAWRGVKGSLPAAAVSDDLAKAQALEKLKRRASNFEKAKADALASKENVPDSEGSFHQDTKDAGIGTMEDELSTKDPVSFEKLRQKQEDARQTALSGVQPEGQGSVVDLQQHITKQLDDADANMAKVANKYVADAQRDAAANGGNKPPEAYGDELRKAILKASDERDAVAKKLLESVHADETGNVASTIDSAKAIRDEAVKNKASLDADESDLINRAIRLRPVERFGVIRQLQSEISKAMRERLNSKAGADESYRRLSMLRGAIEKNLTDTIADVFTGNITSPASSEAAELMRGVDRETLAGAAADMIEVSKAPESPETIFDVARNMPGGGIRPSIVGGEEVSESRAVRKRLPTNALNGKGSTWQDFWETLKQGGWLKYQEQGGEHPNDLMAALNQGNKFYHPEDRTAENLQRRDAIEQEMTEAGITANDKHADKVAKLARARFDKKTLDDSMPGFERTQTAPPKPTSVVKPTVTPEGVESQRKGVAQYKQNRRTFDKGPVGDVTRRSGAADDFRLPESMAPQKFFKPGPGGFQTMQKLYSAIGKDKAIPIVSDYAASSLNKAARRDDGTVDPAKYGRWKASHSESLRALPPDVQAKFDTAATATEWADQMNVSRETAAKEANKGALGKLVRANTPQDITNVIGGVFDMKIGSRDAMRDLATRARSNPAASEGLRQGVMDYIKDKFINNQDKLVGNPFQDFVHEKADVLGEVFKPHEVENIRAVAADLKRSSTALPVHGGGPATARRMGYGLPKSSLRVIMDTLVGSGGAYALHLTGADTVTALAAGGVAGAAAEGLRGIQSAGRQNVDRMLTKAFTDTKFRRELLQHGGLESTKKIMQRSIVGRALNP